MNRPLTAGADGGFVLTPGRFYRLVLRVNGRTSVEDLEDALTRGGFTRETLVASTPDDWRAEAPPDWPVERAASVAANECIVRASGIFEPKAGGAVHVSGELAIHDGASFCVLEAWDYAPDGRTGAAAPLKKKSGDGAMPALLTAGALLGLGLWSSHRRNQRIETETRRLFEAAAVKDAEDLDAETAVLEAAGHRPETARAIAERSITERALEREQLIEGEES